MAQPIRRQCPLSGSGLSEGAFSYSFLDKVKRIYRPISILVRREQQEYFWRLKTAVNYGAVKRQAVTKVSRFELEVSSLEGFFFRSQQLTCLMKVLFFVTDLYIMVRRFVLLNHCLYMYRCNIIWRGYNGEYETSKRSIAVGNFDK